MKKALKEELERQKELMSFMEQSSLTQTIGQGLAQAIKTGLGRSLLNATLGVDDFDIDPESFSTSSVDSKPLTKTTTDDEFYKSILNDTKEHNHLFLLV